MNNLKIFLLACFLAMGYNVSLANVNVVVQVTPSLETKNVGGVVQYNITASYNGTPSVGTEEKAGAVEWQFGGANATAGCTITPSAAETTWKTSNTRSLTGTGTAEGEHLLSFNMRARFEITDKNTGAHIKYAEYSGRGTAKLKITAGKFKIVITPTDNFPGRSKYRLGIGEMATISLVSLSAGKTVTIVPGTTSNPNPSGTRSILLYGHYTIKFT